MKDLTLQCIVVTLGYSLWILPYSCMAQISLGVINQTFSWDNQNNVFLELGLPQEIPSNLNLNNQTLETYSVKAFRTQGDDSLNIGYKLGTNEIKFFNEWNFEPLIETTFEFMSQRFKSEESKIQVYFTCDNFIADCDQNTLGFELFGYSEEPDDPSEKELTDGGILLDGSVTEYIPFWYRADNFEITLTLPLGFPEEYANLSDVSVDKYKLKVSRIWGDDNLEIGYALIENVNIPVYFAQDIDSVPQKYSKFSPKISTDNGQIYILIKCDNLIVNCHDSEFKVEVYGYVAESSSPTTSILVSTPSPAETPSPTPDVAAEERGIKTELIIQVAGALLGTIAIGVVVYFKNILLSCSLSVKTKEPETGLKVVSELEVDPENQSSSKD